MLSAFVSIVVAMGSQVGEGCLVVDRGKITVQDLGPRVPELGSLPPAEVFGFAPAPGQTRVIRVAELNSFLRRFGIRPRAELSTLCVVRRTEPPTRESIISAVQRAFGDRNVRVAVSEYSDLPVPPGMVQFDVAHLPLPDSSDSAIWRGIHRDSDGRTRPFWARVQLAEKVCRLVASKDLPPAFPLFNEALRREVVWEFPNPKGAMPCDPPTEGNFTTRRAIAAGAVIRESDLLPINAVEQGKSVVVLVDSGKVQLSLSGRAETSGHVGERVAFTTSLSRRRYIGVVLKKGVVQVSQSYE